MPWFEGRRCDDCGRDWEAVDWTESVVVGSIDWANAASYLLYTCPMCYLTLRVQREIDGNAWRHWVSTVPINPRESCDQLKRHVASTISAYLDTLDSQYRPAAIQLYSVNCTKCKVPLVAGSVDLPPPICPVCGSSHSSFNGQCGHMSISPVP